MQQTVRKTLLTEKFPENKKFPTNQPTNPIFGGKNDGNQTLLSFLPNMLVSDIEIFFFSERFFEY